MVIKKAAVTAPWYRCYLLSFQKPCFINVSVSRWIQSAPCTGATFAMLYEDASQFLPFRQRGLSLKRPFWVVVNSVDRVARILAHASF